mmetsp:Transcript_293/g.447  ORF Transcript_293/g.447 Transcript_293/m.447 type:complete len:230 (-) Transcript_293:248-937(-)
MGRASSVAGALCVAARRGLAPGTRIAAYAQGPAAFTQGSAFAGGGGAPRVTGASAVVEFRRTWASASATSTSSAAAAATSMAADTGSSSAAAAGTFTTVRDDILLTESCVRRLQELSASASASSDIGGGEVTKAGGNGGGTSGPLLRIAVDGGGCSGFQYTFSLDHMVGPLDRVFEKGGARVVVDDMSLVFVKGATVDYVEEMIKSSFAIADNPNSQSSCGCGTSFAAK